MKRMLALDHGTLNGTPIDIPASTLPIFMEP